MDKGIGVAGLGASHMAEQRLRSLLAMLDKRGRLDWARLADALSGPGEPLDEATRQEMEALLDHDLRRVRVHSGPEVEQLAEYLGADAFTLGTRVFVPRGRTGRGTSGGQGLLAHELTHVVQQTNPSSLPAGPRAGVSASGSAGQRMVQRAPAGQAEVSPSSELESEAMALEQVVQQAAGPPEPQHNAVDLGELADRVYRLMREEIRLERERKGQRW